jgi:hypothetical protein
MTSEIDQPSDKGTLERVLSPIADVRRGEAPSVLLMALTMFLILAAYYLLKTAREVFILSEGGAEVKSYSSAGQAVLLLALVPAYGAFASRVNRVRLVTSVTLFFASNLVLFLLAVQAGLHVAIVYFLWIGIFSLMVIAQFWAFAADLYTREQGSRLFPLIGVGSSLGAWVGSMRAGDLITPHGLGGGTPDAGVSFVRSRFGKKLSQPLAQACSFGCRQIREQFLLELVCDGHGPREKLFTCCAQRDSQDASMLGCLAPFDHAIALERADQIHDRLRAHAGFTCQLRTGEALGLFEAQQNQELGRCQSEGRERDFDAATDRKLGALQ